MMGVLETPRPLSSICRGAGTWSGKVTLSPLPVPKVTHIAPKKNFEKKRELKLATIGDPTADHVPRTFATRHGALLLFADSYKTWRSQQNGDEDVTDQNEKIVQQLKSLKELRSLVLSFGLDDENVIKRISSILHDDSLIQVQPGFTPNRYTSSAVQLWDPQLVDKYLENDGINKSVVERYFELLLPDVTVNGIVLKDTLLGSRPRRFNSFRLPEIRIDPQRRAAMERQQRMSQVRRNPQVMVLPKIDFTHDSYLPDNITEDNTDYFQKHLTRNKVSEQSQRKFWDNYENLSYEEKADLLYRMLVTRKTKDSRKNESDENGDEIDDTCSTILLKKDKDQRKCIFPDLATTTYDPPKFVPECIHRVQLPTTETMNEINDLPPVLNPSIHVTCSPDKLPRETESENTTRNSVNVLNSSLPKDVETLDHLEHPKFAYKPTKLTAYGIAHAEQCRNMLREGRRKDLMILGTSFIKSEDHLTGDEENEAYDLRPSSFPSFQQNKAGRFGVVHEIPTEIHSGGVPKQHVPLHYTTISSPYNLDLNAKRFTTQTKENRFDRVISSTNSSLAGDFDSYRREASDTSLFPGYAATDRSRNSSTILTIGRGSSQHSIPFATNELSSPDLSDRKVSSVDGISPRSCISIVQECNKSEVSDLSSLKNSDSGRYAVNDDHPPPLVDKYDNIVQQADPSTHAPITSKNQILNELKTDDINKRSSGNVESDHSVNLDGSQKTSNITDVNDGNTFTTEATDIDHTTKEDNTKSIYDREASMVPEIIENIVLSVDKITNPSENNTDLKPGSLEDLKTVAEASSESGIDGGSSIDNTFKITGYISTQPNTTPVEKEATQENIAPNDDEGISLSRNKSSDTIVDENDAVQPETKDISDTVSVESTSAPNIGVVEMNDSVKNEDDVEADYLNEEEMTEGRASTIQVFIKTPSDEKGVTPNGVPKVKVGKASVTWEDEEMSPRNGGESVSDLGSSVSGILGDAGIVDDVNAERGAKEVHSVQDDIGVVDTNQPITPQDEYADEYADERDSFASSSLKNISSSTLGDETALKDDVTKPTSAEKLPPSVARSSVSADKGRLSAVVHDVLNRPESGYDLKKDLHAVEAELSKEPSFIRTGSSKQEEKKLESVIEKPDEPVMESPQPKTRPVLEEKEKSMTKAAEPFRVGTAMEEKPKFLDGAPPLDPPKKTGKKASTSKKKAVDKKEKESVKKGTKKTKTSSTPSSPKTTKKRKSTIQPESKLARSEPVIKPDEIPDEKPEPISEPAPPVSDAVDVEKPSPKKTSNLQDKQKVVPNKRGSVQSELSRSSSGSPYRINRSPDEKDEELPEPIPEEAEPDLDKEAERERVLAHKKKREKSAAERRAEMERKRKLLDEKRRLEREEKLRETELYLQKIQEEELRNQQLQSAMEEELRRQEEERRRLAQLEKEKLEAEEIERLKREEEGEKLRKKKLADEEAQRRKMEILMAERQMELEFKRAQEEMARAIEADMREKERLLMEQMAEEERRAYEEQKRLEEALRAKEDAERAAQLAQKRKEEEERREAELEEIMRLQARQLFTSSARKTNRLLEIQQQVSRAYTYSYFNLLPIILYGNSKTPSGKKKNRKVPNLASVLGQLDGN